MLKLFDLHSYQSAKWIWWGYDYILQLKPQEYNQVFRGTYDCIYMSSCFLSSFCSFDCHDSVHSLHLGHTQTKVHWRVCQANYEASYAMQYGFDDPRSDAASDQISHEAPLHNRNRNIGCGSRLITAILHRVRLGPRSKPGMMVGYAHVSKTLWKILDHE